MAIAERRLVWGGIGKLYDAPKPVFFLGGKHFYLPEIQVCLFLHVDRQHGQTPETETSDAQYELTFYNEKWGFIFTVVGRRLTGHCPVVIF